MTIAKGLGYFIWNLRTSNRKGIADLMTLDQFIELLKRSLVSWVSIKIGDGQTYWNRVNNIDDELEVWIQSIRSAGIAVGGWWYLRPYSTAVLVQPSMINGLIGRYQLDHVLYDVEKEWKQTGLDKAIDDALTVYPPPGFPGGFCSYRYPALHSPLNFSRFLHNPTINMNAPQVYWMGAHNPVAQLDKSYQQYQVYDVDMPFVPIGSAYGANVSGVWWEPTETDLTLFVQHCKQMGWQSYGFWSMDWIIQHNKYNWLSAIAGAEVLPPEPPPPPPPPPVELPRYVYTTGNVTNVRNAPILAEMSDIGDLTKGATLKVLGQSGDFYQFEAFVHKSVVADSNTPPPPPVKTGWYIAHDREIVYPEGHEHAGKPILWRHDVPEVFHFDVKGNMGAWVITKAWQELIMALNPGMLGDSKPIDDGGGFRDLLWWNRAFDNGPGYDNPNGVPRRDWINGRDLDAADPIADKSRICGGAFVHGVLNGNILTIETLDGTKDPPPLDWILARPWLYFECLTVHADGTNGRFPQNGHGKRPVYFPLVASEPQTVQINTVVEAKPYPYVTKI